VRCPLYPRKRTSLSRAVMSALCQKRTLCGAAKRPLAERVLGGFPPKICGDEARRIAVTSFCGKPKRKAMRALFCAAHLVLNTLVDEFGALIEW